MLQSVGCFIFIVTPPVSSDSHRDYTPNKISNWSLFKLIFSDQALIILIRILAIYVCFNRQMLSGVFINLSFNPQFLGKNAKI